MGENCFHLVSGHAREPLHELVDGCSVSQVVEESGDRYPGTPEYPRSTDLGGVALDGGARAPVVHGHHLRCSFSMGGILHGWDLA